MKQNITLSLDKTLIKKAKIVAVQRDTSLSGLLTDCLEQLTAQEESYQAAQRAALKHLARGYDLGGRRLSARSSLHER